MSFLDNLRDKAKKQKKNIILPESEDERVLKACSSAQQSGIAQITLIGEHKEILDRFVSLGLEFEGIEVVSIKDNIPKYVELLMEVRKKENLSEDDARRLLEDKLCYGCMAVRARDAHGMVAGAINKTSDVLRNAIKYVGTATGVNTVSGFFIAILDERTLGENSNISPILGLADCAVNSDPDIFQLGEIAITSAQTFETLVSKKANVAMLSFSTKGSSDSSVAKKVVEATKIAKDMNPSLIIDGELQLDAALIKDIAMKKAPDSQLEGGANVLIFPDLNSGNIAYKLIQRIGCAVVVGPILQGLQYPVNDLSRGCDQQEIEDAITITALQR